MRTIVAGVAIALAVVLAFAIGRLSAQEGVASCRMCPSTYIPRSEIAQYEAIGRATNVIDQQMRALDVGKAQVEIALVHRGKLDAPAQRSVATHDLVSEVYYILSGSGTNRTGPDVVDPQRRPPDDRAVRLLNGPGANATDLRNPAEHELKAGDVLVIPGRHRPPVHEDRRPHHVPDDPRRSRQGRAAHERDGLARVSRREPPLAA